MTPRRRALLVVLAASAACERAPAYEPVATVKDLMASVIEPAADVYWDAVGTVDDSSGTTVTYPRSPDEWKAVRASAVVVTESGNLLLMPPRARPDSAWGRLTRSMIAVGRRAIAAAEAQDTSAVFRIGADLYDACTECHARYTVPAAPPR